MSELYDDDILLWSERQAELLRRAAATARANDAIDWPNIIEEIESVGQSQVDAVESWLYQALLHILKAEAWPLSEAVPHWRAKARGFRAQARRKYRPSMRQKLDVAGLYAARSMPCRKPSTASRRNPCLRSARSRWTNCCPTTDLLVGLDIMFGLGSYAFALLPPRFL